MKEATRALDDMQMRLNDLLPLVDNAEGIQQQFDKFKNVVRQVAGDKLLSGITEYDIVLRYKMENGLVGSISTPRHILAAPIAGKVALHEQFLNDATYLARAMAAIVEE